MYAVRSSQSGDTIDYCDSMQEAKALVEKFEQEDKQDGIYEKDFYEIIEVNVW